MSVVKAATQARLLLTLGKHYTQLPLTSSVCHNGKCFNTPLFVRVREIAGNLSTGEVENVFVVRCV